MLSRRRKRAILGFLFVGAFVVLLFFSVARYFAALEERRRYLDERANLEPRPPNVYVVERGDRVQERKFAAAIEPWRAATLASEVSAQVERITVEIGDRVARGDVLVELDDDLAQAALAAAEARVAENRRLLAERRKLAEREVAARTELEAARARLAISEAELDQARENLALHTVKAPFDGAVNARHVEVGDLARQGTRLLELVDTARLRVVFHVSDSEIASFERGQTVALWVNGRPGPPLEPEVRFLAEAAHPSTRLFRVEAVLDAPPAGLRGGQQGSVVASIEIHDDSLFVPAAAVRLAGDSALVTRAGDGETGVELTEIEIGPEVDGMYPVLDGLAEGDRILIQ